MRSQRLKKEYVLTIPNLLSLFRILLIPLIVWLYCGPKYYKATIAAIVISGATDIIDGKIARKFNMVSDVGKVLDPVADKLTQVALVICLLDRYRWMWALLILFVVKEGLMVWWGYLTLKLTDAVNSARWYGKVSTAVLYAVMMILIFFVDIPETAARILIFFCGAVMLMSLILYGRFYRSILKKSISNQKHQKVTVAVLKIILVLVWTAIILFCFLHRNSISVSGILRYTPHNLWMAAIVMLTIFALKSLSIIIYSGILYTANGMLFPIPIAITLNLFGTVIMLSLPYYIGRKTGTSTVNYIKAKYPKAEALHELRAQNDLFFSFIIRIIGLLPYDIVSLYMGAVNVEYRKYILGGLLGTLPPMITFPIMGMSITDIHSPQFLIAFGVELAFAVFSTMSYVIYWKRHRQDNGV